MERGSKGRAITWIVVIVGLLALGVGAFFVVTRLVPLAPAETVSDAAASPTPTIPDAGGVPLDQQPDPQNAPTGPGGVTPFVVNVIPSTDGSAAVVYSLVPGLAENGGTCTATLSDGTATATATGVAEVQVATTTCPPLTVSLAGLPSGAGSLVVSYASPTVSGSSDPVPVEVP